MIDTAGISAAILPIATAGQKLSIDLRDLLQTVRASSVDYVHDLSTSISIHCRVFRRVAICLGDNACPCSETALTTIELESEFAHAVFNFVGGMVYQFRQASTNQVDSSLRRTAKAVFNRPMLEFLTEEIRSATMTLEIMVQVFELRSIMDELSECVAVKDLTNVRSGTLTSVASGHGPVFDESLIILRRELQALILDRVWTQREADNIMDEDLHGPQRHLNEPSQSSANGVVALFEPTNILDEYIRPDGAQSISFGTISTSYHIINQLLDTWSISTPMPKSPSGKKNGYDSSRGGPMTAPLAARSTWGPKGVKSRGGGTSDEYYEDSAGDERRPSRPQALRRRSSWSGPEERRDGRGRSSQRRSSGGERYWERLPSEGRSSKKKDDDPANNKKAKGNPWMDAAKTSVVLGAWEAIKHRKDQKGAKNLGKHALQGASGGAPLEGLARAALLGGVMEAWKHRDDLKVGHGKEAGKPIFNAAMNAMGAEVMRKR